MGSMTRRDILKGLAAFAACVRAYAKTPQGAGSILVRVGERHSDICLVRGRIEVTRESIPIGHWHFVNDVGCCLRIKREHAMELVKRYGILPEAERQGTLALALDYRRHENGDTSYWRIAVPRKLLADIVEARAIELAEFIRDCLNAAGMGEIFDEPVFLEGARVIGLAGVVERIAGWEVRCGTPTDPETRVM
jgi:cell division ATPase FtsA